MTANLVLAITAGILVAAGVYLLLERSLTRILLGVLVTSNGVNLLFLVAAGEPGAPPIVGLADPGQTSDALPQAMVLTAIVISLGTTAFILALAHRSWQLNGHDEVQDDLEDARIRALAQAAEASDSFEEIKFDDTGEDVVSE